MPITQVLLTATTAQGGGGGGGGGGSVPAPGSGSYNSEWPNSAGWSAQGLVSDPGSGVGGITNQTAGWIRRTYSGTWSNGGGNDNPSLFNGTATDTVADGYGGFGQTSTSDSFAIEWKGYFAPFVTGTYNFLLDSDDVAMFWIGDGALNPEGFNPWCTSNNGSQLNPNSASLTQGFAYPIRMRFQEWSGAERCQLYLGRVGTGTPLYAMNAWYNNMLYNSATTGYNA